MLVDRTIHVLDDDAAARRSLRRLLDAAGFTTVSYRSAPDFLEVVPGLAAGCLLMALRMPAVDRWELVARIAGLNVHMPIIATTTRGDVQTAVGAMKAGAANVIETPCGEAILIEAIESALAEVNGNGSSSEVANAARRIASLSPREREVLDALVAGRPNKVIAHDLGISVRTVEVHRARMMDRLGVRRLGKAVRLAVLATLV
jgi:two-component system response regulator FixJ